MLSNRLKISIDLSPEVSKDDETGQYVAKFDGLPLIAFDESEDVAVLRLISLLEVFLKEQKEMVYDRMLKAHIEQAVKQQPSYNLIQIHGDKQNEMRLQMVS